MYFFFPSFTTVSSLSQICLSFLPGQLSFLPSIFKMYFLPSSFVLFPPSCFLPFPSFLPIFPGIPFFSIQTCISFLSIELNSLPRFLSNSPSLAFLTKAGYSGEKNNLTSPPPRSQQPVYLPDCLNRTFARLCPTCATLGQLILPNLDKELKFPGSGQMCKF